MRKILNTALTLAIGMNLCLIVLATAIDRTDLVGVGALSGLLCALALVTGDDSESEK